MRPYIYARQNLIHIIDVRETVRGLLRAKKYLQQLSAAGNLILFVGTKRQAAETIEREALRCGMPFVSDRWLGGTLTNFHDDSQSPCSFGGARTIAFERRTGHLQQENAIRAGAGISQDVPEFERRTDHESLAQMLGCHRPQEGAKRGPRGLRKMGISTVALIDTDSDPDTVDVPIPGNDDSIRSIELVVQQLADAVLEGTSHCGRRRARQGGDSNPAPVRRVIDPGGRGDHGQPADRFSLPDSSAVATHLGGWEAPVTGIDKALRTTGGAYDLGCTLGAGPGRVGWFAPVNIVAPQLT